MKSRIPVYDIQTFEEYKNQGIFIGRFGEYSKAHKHLHTAHSHSFFHMVYFTKAEGRQQIDFENIAVQAGQIYFMIPGQVHSWNFEDEPEGYIINFSNDYFNSFLLNTEYLNNFSFFDGSPKHQVISIEESKREKIKQLFEDLLCEGTSAAEDDLVKVLVLQLFFRINRMVAKNYDPEQYSQNHMLIKNFNKLIEKNFITKRLPKDYAAFLFITPNHLNAVCIKVVGKSAGKMIRERIILEAKRLLINLDLNISEIANKLQFKDQSYFSKFFKKYELITPEKFRKQNTL